GTHEMIHAAPEAVRGEPFDKLRTGLSNNGRPFILRQAQDERQDARGACSIHGSRVQSRTAPVEQSGMLFNSYEYLIYFLPLPHTVLPLGISFFTFTQIAYLVDVHRGRAKEPSLLNYALFVSFFPHLLAGPILHHSEMMPQFASLSNKQAQPFHLAAGLFLLAIGLVKKVCLADPLAPVAAAGFDHPEAISALGAWLAVLAYTLQIYFDFSGYTDMALGAARMFNIQMPVNFNSPYHSTDIRE